MNISDDGETRFYCQCKSISTYENGICKICGGIEDTTDVDALRRYCNQLSRELDIEIERYDNLRESYKQALCIIREQSESIGRLICMTGGEYGGSSVEKTGNISTPESGISDIRVLEGSNKSQEVKDGLYPPAGNINPTR